MRNLKGEYLRRIALTVQGVQKRALQASVENSKQQQMQAAQQMRLGYPVQGTQGGGSSLLAMAPQAASSSVMASPAVQQPFQQPQPHIAGPSMQIRPSNTMMAVANQNVNPQFATFATIPGINSGQQIVQSVPIQSQNRLQAMQPQNHRKCLGSYNSASVAQLQGRQQVVRTNAQRNHLLNQNASGTSGLQQQPMQLVRNQQAGLGVNQHQMNSSQWQQMVESNNPANLSVGYPEGSSSQQSVGCSAGLCSLLQACEQEALNKQTTFETQLTTRAFGSVTINQQGNAHCINLPQTPATTSPGQAVDWRDKMFPQIQSWKAAYLSELMELNRTFVIPKITKEQFQSLPKQKAEQYQRILHVKNRITGVLNFLQTEKSKIPETWKEMLATYEATIHKLLDYHRKMKANTIGSNFGRESLDHNGKPQSIGLTGDSAPINGRKSSHGQQNESKQLADARVSRIRQNVVTETAPANTKGSNIGRESQDHHRKPQTIDLTADSASYSGGKSTQENRSKQPANASVSQLRQEVVTETAPAHLKTDSSDPQGVRSPCSSVKSPGELEYSLSSDIEPGLETWASEESLFFIEKKSRILSTNLPCSSVESTLLSTAAKSRVRPVVSPCNLVESKPSKDTTNCQQVTPSELTVPDSLGPAQEAATYTEDVASHTANTSVAKPVDRLINAIRALSPEVLRSTVDSMKSAIAAMDAVPMYKMKRSHDVTSSCSEPPHPDDSLDISGAESCKERATKKQKTQNSKEVLLAEIEAINSNLIDTSVNIFGGNPGAATTSCHGRTLIRLMYTGCLAGTTEMQGLVKPATVFVPADYPANSPTLICDGEEEQLRKSYSSVSDMVDVAFRRALSDLPEPRSLKEMAGAWDTCVRRAVMDYVQQHSGGVRFCRSSYSLWESCVGAEKFCVAGAVKRN